MLSIYGLAAFLPEEAAPRPISRLRLRREGGRHEPPSAFPVHLQQCPPVAPPLAKVPVAAVRRHLERREPPPPIVDELIRTTYRAIVDDYRTRTRSGDAGG
jgi:hypothetical protein